MQATKRRMTPKQQAYRFFYAYAGSSYNPQTETLAQGKARGARQLAKAERDAVALGYTFSWRHDDDGCIGCTCGASSCDCYTGADHEVLSCLMLDPQGDTVQSLSGICKPTREYQRVIQAELALEQFKEEI